MFHFLEIIVIMCKELQYETCTRPICSEDPTRHRLNHKDASINGIDAIMPPVGTALLLRDDDNRDQYDNHGTIRTRSTSTNHFIRGTLKTVGESNRFENASL